jgi:hypothetical protein
MNRRRGLRYQRGNQNSYIEEEQTIQWPKDRRTDNTMTNTKKDKRINNDLKNMTL